MKLVPISGRWYRSTNDGATDETLQLESKGAVAYTRESGRNIIKSYGTWRRTGASALFVKLPIKDMRRNDEKGFVLRIETGRLVPAEGEPWVRARVRRIPSVQPLEGRYTLLVKRPGNSDLITIELRPGGDATLVRAPSGGTEEEVGGRWEMRGSDVVVKFEEMSEMVFAREGTSLQARTWDRTTFGDTAPRLLRSPKS